MQAFDGDEAISNFAKYSFDLIILDLMIPKVSGMDFLKNVRENSKVPILILSAKDSDIDKALVWGLAPTII